MTSSRTKLILMYGGCSGEHEISLLSAGGVFSALSPNRFDITCLAGDKSGQWFLHQYDDLAKQHQSDAPLPIETATSQAVQLSLDFFKDIDVVLPIIHGPFFEDGRLQGFLDLCDVPYVGSGHLGSAISMDKHIAKVVAASAGLAVAPYYLVRHHQWQQNQAQEVLQQAIESLGFPMFVKPACMGSSVGIRRCQNSNELHEAVQDALRYDHKVLLEQAIVGREIEVAVLKQQHQILCSVAGEISMQDEDDFYSYQAKYQDEQAAVLHCPASLSAEQLSTVQALAKKAFSSLECDGLARVDFFLDESQNQFILNEVNTLPGFTKISMYPKLWQQSGLNYGDLLEKLIEQAVWSHQQSKALLREYL